MIVQSEVYCRSAPSTAAAAAAFVREGTTTSLEEQVDAAVDKVRELVNTKVSSWWHAGKAALTEFKDDVMKSAVFSPSKSNCAAATGDGPCGNAEDGMEFPAMGGAGAGSFKPYLFADFQPSPVVRGSSNIISGKSWCRLWGDLPPAEQYKAAHLVFDTAEDGYSLRNFLHKSTDIESSILVVRTETGAVFGAYLSAPWRRSDGRNPNFGRYWGSNATFVFGLAPTYVKYSWVGHAEGAFVNGQRPTELFMTVSKTLIAVGGGGNGHALELDDDLHRGFSDTCHTFLNAPLHSKVATDGASDDGEEASVTSDSQKGGADGVPESLRRTQFKCVQLEMWALLADDVEL
jgi:hypothetical protein